jgi:hypothetical protein
MFSMIDESKCDEENYLTKSLTRKLRLHTLFKEREKASKREVIDNV